METKIKDFLCRLAFFAADGMGEDKLVEFAKQADALLKETARKQANAYAERDRVEKQLRFYGEVRAGSPDNPIKKVMREAADIVAANLGDRVQVPAELVGGAP